MPAINERVTYRSFAGDIWSAMVTNVRLDGKLVDLDVDMPGGKGPWPLKAVRWYDDPKEPLPGARPKVA